MKTACAKPIILLDLVATLVENQRDCWYVKPIEARMAKERYRQWLVELIRPYHVILITARSDRVRAQTLANIAAKTGWSPREAYFNDMDMAPHTFKALALTQSIWPAHGAERPYFAIESNAATRRMYFHHGVPALPIPKGGEWTHLPFEASMEETMSLALNPREAAPGELIVLLDLNYTLVANQKETRYLRPFSRRLEAIPQKSPCGGWR